MNIGHPWKTVHEADEDAGRRRIRNGCHKRLASVTDAGAIYRIMVEVQRELLYRCEAEGYTDSRDFFLISDLDRVRSKLINPDGFGWIVEATDRDGIRRPVGYYLFAVLPMGSVSDIAEKPRTPESGLASVCEADSVAILPEWRGLGLQRELQKLGEDEARRRKCRYMIATVHPRNERSLRNFCREGYAIEARVSIEVPEDRVLRDGQVASNHLITVERYVVRKDLAQEES